MPDPFDLLGVEPRFDLDLSQVEQRHRDLSKALHPDRFTGTPATERRLALSRAIDVNEAMRVLRDPVRRAEALLRRAGVAIGETLEPKPPADLLMEMMDVREELAEARRSKDRLGIEKLSEGMRRRQAEVEGRLAQLLETLSSRTDAGAEVLPALGELRYVRRFLDEVTVIQEELLE